MVGVPDQDSAPSKSSVLLRRWPFSSTTVTFANCSNEPFPKQGVNISEAREGSSSPMPRFTELE